MPASPAQVARAVALLQAHGLADVADVLVGPVEEHPRARRARLLRLAWRTHFPFAPRTAAAKAIASAMAAYVLPDGEEPPGTLEHVLQRLLRGGCPRLHWATIDRLLDAALD